MPKKSFAVHPEGHPNAGKPTGLIRFEFEDQSVQELDITTLPQDMILRLAIHGALQKGGDSYAGAKSEPKPIEFAKESVSEVLKQLRENNWRVTSPGGPRITDLATVFAEINGVTVEEAVEFVGGLDEAQTKELRNQPKVKAKLAAIVAKRAAEKAAKLAEEAEKAA